jgi:hypothetical protein
LVDLWGSSGVQNSMSDVEKPVEKFEWNPSIDGADFTARAGLVSLEVFQPYPEEDGYASWKFKVGPYCTEANFSRSTTLKLEAEGWSYTVEEAKAEAEMFGYRMQKVVSVLYEPIPAPVPPIVGDDIYIPTITREDGSLFWFGGKARIKEATLERPQFDLCWLVALEEIPGQKFDYRTLLEQQKMLSAKFKNQRASVECVVLEQTV